MIKLRNYSGDGWMNLELVYVTDKDGVYKEDGFRVGTRFDHLKAAFKHGFSHEKTPASPAK